MTLVTPHLVYILGSYGLSLFALLGFFLWAYINGKGSQQPPHET